MKFCYDAVDLPGRHEKLKADTNGQVEIIAEDNPTPITTRRHAGR